MKNNNKLKQKSKALCNKLDLIGKDESFLGVFSMADIHGVKYSGPTWIKELEELKEELNNG